MFSRALALAERRPMAALRARALAALGSLDVLRVGSSERVALAREAALDAGMAALAAASTHDLAMLGVLRFELDDARAWAEQTVLLGRRYRLGWVLAAGLIKHAWVAALTGSSGGSGAGAGRGRANRRQKCPWPRADQRSRPGCGGAGARGPGCRVEAVEGAAELWWGQRLEPRPYLGLWVLLAGWRIRAGSSRSANDSSRGVCSGSRRSPASALPPKPRSSPPRRRSRSCR